MIKPWEQHDNHIRISAKYKALDSWNLWYQWPSDLLLSRLTSCRCNDAKLRRRLLMLRLLILMLMMSDINSKLMLCMTEMIQMSMWTWWRWWLMIVGMHVIMGMWCHLGGGILGMRRQVMRSSTMRQQAVHRRDAHCAIFRYTISGNHISVIFSSPWTGDCQPVTGHHCSILILISKAILALNSTIPYPLRILNFRHMLQKQFAGPPRVFFSFVAVLINCCVSFPFNN